MFVAILRLYEEKNNKGSVWPDGDIIKTSNPQSWLSDEIKFVPGTDASVSRNCIGSVYNQWSSDPFIAIAHSRCQGFWEVRITPIWRDVQRSDYISKWKYMCVSEIILHGSSYLKPSLPSFALRLPSFPRRELFVERPVDAFVCLKHKNSIPVPRRVSANVFLTPSRLLWRFSSPGRRAYAWEILLYKSDNVLAADGVT